MFAVFFIVLTPTALAACVLAARAATRARREHRTAGHLVLAALAIGALCLAWPVHGYGQMSMFYFMVDEECPARGAGEFVDFQERILPVSGVLECTDRSIQLVPAWVNPTVMMLHASGAAAALAASIVWARRRRESASA